MKRKNTFTLILATVTVLTTAVATVMYLLRNRKNHTRCTFYDLEE